MRLITLYRFTGLSLEWLRSFLDEWTLGSDVPNVVWTPILFSVLQSSILGPLIYILYTADLTLIITSLGSWVHQYANDVQLYSSYQPFHSVACLTSVLNTVSELPVQGWMSLNWLWLNPAKTQYLWIRTRQMQSQIAEEELLSSLLDCVSQHIVCDLGVLNDGEISVADHVNSVCRSTSFVRFNQYGMIFCLTLQWPCSIPSSWHARTIVIPFEHVCRNSSYVSSSQS